MASLLEELKRRNVIRVAVGYLVLAWVVLQITDLVAPALRLPEWTLSFVTFVGIIGFPFALFFAWIFELTPEGLKRSEDVEPQESITSTTAGNLNKVIIGLLCVAVVTLLADRFFGLSQMLAPADEPVIAEAPQVAADADAVEDDKPRSIAVLPFVNMSDDKEQEYFSDGISEELLNALAQIQELRVAARTSSFAFKGKNQDIKNIGEQLDVETVLEGSVRKSGARVRITAQLINVDDGYHLWSNTYDRDLTDIFAVQDEISAAIVEALKVHLTDDALPRSEKPVDIAAYNLFLQARNNLRARTRQSLELALTQFQQALDIEPRYAAAWAGKALATQLLQEEGYGDTPLKEAARLAQRYVDTAFSIDPDLWEAHAAQALIYMDLNRWPEALASIDRALSVVPNEGILYAWKSLALGAVGEYGAATEALEQGFTSDPLHSAVRWNWMRQSVIRGDIAAVRSLTTAGTADFYRAEWMIAAREGRWADMYQLMDEAEKSGFADDRMAFYRGVNLFDHLGEPERGIQTLPWSFGGVYSAAKEPFVILDKFEGIGPEDLTSAQRQVLLVALSRSGRCGNVPKVLDHLQLEAREAFGDVARWDGPYANAVVLAGCLSELGELVRARALAENLIAHSRRVEHEYLLLQDYGHTLSMLQVILGDLQGAIETLGEMWDSNGLLPISFIVLAPQYRELEDQDGFRQLRANVQAKLNGEREKLGWPPKALEEI